MMYSLTTFLMEKLSIGLGIRGFEEIEVREVFRTKISNEENPNSTGNADLGVIISAAVINSAVMVVN